MIYSVLFTVAFWFWSHGCMSHIYTWHTQKNDDYITDPSVSLKLMIIISCGKFPYKIMCHKFWNCSVIIMCLNAGVEGFSLSFYNENWIAWISYHEWNLLVKIGLQIMNTWRNITFLPITSDLLVGWFFSKATQKLQNRFPRNLVR